MSPPLPKFLSSIFTNPTPGFSVLRSFSRKEINANNLTSLKVIDQHTFQLSGKINKLNLPRENIFIKTNRELEPLATPETEEKITPKIQRIRRGSISLPEKESAALDLEKATNEANDLLADKISLLSSEMSVQAAMIEILTKELLPVESNPLVMTQLSNTATKETIAGKLNISPENITLTESPQKIILIPEKNKKVVRIQTSTDVIASIKHNPGKENETVENRLIMKFETTYRVAPTREEDTAQLSVISHKEIGNARFVKELLPNYKLSFSLFGRSKYSIPIEKKPSPTRQKSTIQQSKELPKAEVPSAPIKPVHPLPTVLFKPQRDHQLEVFISGVKKSLSTLLFATNQKLLLKTIYDLPEEKISSLAQYWSKLGVTQLRNLNQEIDFFEESMSDTICDFSENFNHEQIKNTLLKKFKDIQESLQKYMIEERHIARIYTTPKQSLKKKQSTSEVILEVFREIKGPSKTKQLTRDPSLAFIDISFK